MYAAGEYDLAGFAVGVVEKSAVIDGSSIAAGDVVLGLASDGAHSNGYSLIRKIVESCRVDLESVKLDGQPLADLVLAPTRIYVKPVLELLARVRVKGLAHITGGGLVENVPRVLGERLTARLDASSWPLPPLFSWLEREGQVPRNEMWRVFNCGIGMVLVVDAAQAASAIETLRGAGETVYRIGEIERRPADGAQTVIV